jgi:L-lactate dehydrogenase (cytochrome)
MLGKPGWLLALLRAKRRDFGNMAAAVKRAGDMPFSQFVQSQFDASVTWEDLERYRAQWKGRLVIKGIMDAEDARRAVQLGADAIVVSNHGGRQLDGAPSSIAMLPSIIDAVQGRAEVLLDSGVRSGQDVLKARALGAQAVLVGRAWIYGLGALGEQGVRMALDIIARELQVSLALTGCNDVNDLGPRHLV